MGRHAGVWAKVHEELDELKEAVISGDQSHAQEELGDLLFTLVNVARWCGIAPEEGLAGTNRRFLDRFFTGRSGPARQSARAEHR